MSADRDSGCFSRRRCASALRCHLLLAMLLAGACTERSASVPPSGGGGSSRSVRRAFPSFTDVTLPSGIRFEHENGFNGRNYRVAETVTGGVALLDFDGDGALDIYFTNARRRGEPGPTPRNALFRGAGDGTFRDVSAASGTDDDAFSLGCCAADITGDRLPEIYVTNDGPNRLYRNNGNGTFSDIAGALGLDQESMDAGCAFLDMEGDGDLDLYVASYVIDDRPDGAPALVQGVPSYWPPLNYRAAPDHLYQNLGDGRFADVSAASGIRGVEPARGLGVVAADFNDDGFQDIYVANDMTANFLFLGDGKGRFREVALASGVALGIEGEPQGSMGIAVWDYDGNGLLDLCVTNYQGQLNNLFRAADREFYEDVVHVTGVSIENRLEVSWGVGFVDFDADGRRDLFVVNGHLNPHTHRMNDGTSYEQLDRVFRGVGGGEFDEVSSRSGDAARTSRSGRGAAFGDIDNDGDMDAVVVHSKGAPAVLRNECNRCGSWVLLRLAGSGGNRDGIGARVRVHAGGGVQTGVRLSSSSYLSVDDPRLHFGLGEPERIERLEVRWPDGHEDAWEDLPARRLIVLTRGRREHETFELAPRARMTR